LDNNKGLKKMRRRILFIVFFGYLIATLCSAQELGVRLGDVTGGHVAIDGVFSVGQFSRVHADISFGNGVGIDALWDFIYRPLGEEAFNWYLGAGPYIQIDDPFWLGAAFEAGLEYRFTGIPLALGFDWRPALSIIERTDLHFEGFGFNIRYVFGKLN
jgi:hypothetical protein